MLPQILLDIPFSTIFILLLAVAITLLTSLANRELRNAKRSGDKKRVEKLMKKQQHILQLQSKMMWQSTKIMLMFFVPLIIIWQILGGDYGSAPIAYFPGIGPNLPIPLFSNSLVWWYMMCSFLFNTVFSHLFGLVSVE